MATIPPPIDCGFNEDKMDIIISSLSFLFLIPALIINGIVVWVCMHMQSTSTFIVYLKNLVAADLLMILTIPFKAAKDMPSAPLALKAYCCRYSDVIMYLCVYMSIILLGLISLDRFFKIVRPHGRLLGQNVVFGKVLSASIWVVMLIAVAIPTMVLTNQDLTNNTKGSCMKMKSQAGRNWHEGVVIFDNMIFWLVCVLIFFCYICITRKVIQSYRKSGSSNDKRMYKTKVRVFMVLLVFLVCFLPYHVICIQYTKYQVTTMPSCTKTTLRISKRITLWTATMNVCLDPLIYFFLCKTFRNTLLKTLHLKSGTCNWLIRRASDPNPRNTAQDNSASKADAE
ncbi:P2Y purinoceptor 14 [Esox lucius]|uniref:G-protein coupled receptors family 1 profile domain-containing protein n=1 Tax=Esox lucius TaxID=8010 RepID=A0AAY5JYA1_ESOLU|nr:P2Y purinoceptor 14 [Esox lucius]XP_019900904.2 P2Y purinoceptor 14 [Esox lucius]